MKAVFNFLLIVCLFLSTVNGQQVPLSPAIYQNWEKGFTTPLQYTHDMALPDWGPYSNSYNGLSHVASENDGFRFDLVVQPSLYLRNLTRAGNVLRESGYHAWEATPDLSYFSYRYQLEWKDQVYCDVSFSKSGNMSRIIRAEFVNNTTANRSLALNYFGSIALPYDARVRAILPPAANWYKAADYASFTATTPYRNYHLVYDGQLRGQSKDRQAVSHTCIVLGKNPGERLHYSVDNNKRLTNGVIAFRYRTIGKANIEMVVEINGKQKKILNLGASPNYAVATLDVKDLPPGPLELSLEIPADEAIALDGFTIVGKDDLSELKFKEEELSYVSKEIDSGLPNALILKFQDINHYYGLVWQDHDAEKRVVLHDDLDFALAKFENLVKNEGRQRHREIVGNRKGWYANVFSAPIVLEPKQKTVRYAYVVYGNTEDEVRDKLRQLDETWADAGNIFQRQKSKADSTKVNKAGEPYQFSHQLMSATTLTNLMYPTFAGGKYLKHTTPGKRWSSFYTWDAGFIGLGYAALNPGRALESLNAYTMDKSEQSAFLEHGTPLPVQAYLFNELWNRTQNTEFLKYFYPRLKRYYEFLGGAEGSTTRELSSNLLKTWDIFYNSGGWDDYSPQVFVHQKKLEKSVAPAINTSHQIRFAKLMKMAAWQLGYQKDVASYEADIKAYSHALQQYSWDPDAGYYSYVRHDASGNAADILKHPSGVNFNMGLDGCSPLIAGICTPEQQQEIVTHLFTKGQLWTDQGITAIDQRAPYYNQNGYWNGRVWMPHQWFFWKAMFDINEPEKAIKIAQTALEVWKRETGDTYNCWENFSVETGNGGGWHQFGALSSPVLNWFTALYQPGNITHGFNIWPISQNFNINKDGFKGRFKLFTEAKAKAASMLICLDDQYEYQAKLNGKSIFLTKVFEGLYIVPVVLRKGSDEFSLEVSRLN